MGCPAPCTSPCFAKIALGGGPFPSTLSSVHGGERGPVTLCPFFEELQVLPVEAKEQRSQERSAMQPGCQMPQAQRGHVFHGIHTQHPTAATHPRVKVSCLLCYIWQR